MNSPAAHIIEVAIPLHLEGTFSYLVPAGITGCSHPGVRVLVPFGRRKLTGYVLGKGTHTVGTLREILEVLDPEPLFTPQELKLFRWISSYYLVPLGEVLKTALPSGINLQSKIIRDTEDCTREVMTGGMRVRMERFYHLADSGTPHQAKGKSSSVLELLQQRGALSGAMLRETIGPCSSQLKRLSELGVITVELREVYRDPFRQETFEHDTPLPLNTWQADAVTELMEAIAGEVFAPFLLHGVTGSGKTEVYLQAIAHVLAKDKTALVLVPEIALTPQLVGRFKRRFRCGIAVLHSGLSDGERYDEWRRIRRGEVTIVIGARSAIFAPIPRLGMIVVDEEHESSYKQSEGVRYNARDLALVRGQMSDACVVLGSATPLVTTYHAMTSGKLGYLHLPCRVRDIPMPGIELLDARGIKGESFLPEMCEAIAVNLAQGGQTLIFLNRRGFATYLTCQDCGHVLRCPNCAVTLTYHRGKGRHICHYCDFTIPAPSLCPTCQSPEIVLLGRGTERVEDELLNLFPSARISRMDRDTTRGRGGHARVLKGLEDGTTDILIGTQMIAKGHDFPGVTLVGVISTDAILNLPDFRSSERAFQLISQVSGRAGRGDAPGRVLVQSLAPDHYALVRAVSHDYLGFFNQELEFRRETGYPPFTFLAGITMSSTTVAGVEKSAMTAAGELRQLKQQARVKVEVLGPVTAPLGKIRGRYRFQILLKAVKRTELHRLLQLFKARFKPPGVVRMTIDVDPVDML